MILNVEMSFEESKCFKGSEIKEEVKCYFDDIGVRDFNVQKGIDIEFLDLRELVSEK